MPKFSQVCVSALRSIVSHRKGMSALVATMFIVSGFFINSGVALADTVVLYPDGIGNFDQWSLGAGATKLIAVGSGDITDTTYISETADGEAQTFTVPGADLPVGSTINSVTINAVARNTAGIASIQLRLEKGALESDISDGPSIDLTDSYVAYSRVLTTNPLTGLAWTISEVNSWTSRFGAVYEDIDTGNDGRITQISVVVDYTPDVISPVIAPHGNEVVIADILGGATVNYDLPIATDNIDPIVTTACLPASGSVFPIGDTIVTCNATDLAGNLAVPTTFTVTVNPDVVSATESTIIFDNASQMTINGGTATFIITAKDQYGNVISGVSVILASTGSNNTFSPPNPGITNSSGWVQMGLQSTKAEVKTISATVGGVLLATTIPVSFIPGTPANGTINASTTTPEADLAGTTVTLTIDVTDGSGNSVPDGTIVSLLASPGGIIGGSGNTIGGIVTRTLTFINKGSVTLSFSGLDALGDTTINFIDTTKPEIVAHDDIVGIEATSHDGAEVTYETPLASDNIDGVVSVSCLPVSGSIFVLGDNTVTCTAIDASENIQTSTFIINVVDTINPEITAPVDITSEATGPLTLVTLGSPIVTDIADASPVVINDAPDSGFAPGVTAVTWTATDSSGNFSTATQIITILDTTSPIIDFYEDILNVESSIDPTLGVEVDFTAPMSHDLVDGDLPAECFPVSGSTFYLGTNIVACSKTDAHGNVATSTTFNVVVVDTTNPNFSATAPETGSFIKSDFTVSYTLSEALASGSITFNSPVEYTYILSGKELAIGSHIISNDSLINAGILLSDGIHSIAFVGTDMSGNVGTLTNTDITYDATNPSILNVDSSQADGSYTVGTIVPIDIEFSENVSVTGEPTLQIGVGSDRFATYAGSSDPSSASSEPLDTLETIVQLTDNTTDESEVDVAERSGVIHRAYVRGGNVYYSNSAGVGEELVGVGSSPSIAVGPNGVAQVTYVSGGNVMFATKADWSSAVVVSAGSSPDIDVDSNNFAHIVFKDKFYGDNYIDVVYANNVDGSFIVSGIWNGIYIDFGGSSGYMDYYESAPYIKLDGNGKYHIITNHHNINKTPGWIDHSYDVVYTTNAGSGLNSSGPNGTLGNNPLTIDASNKAHIVYDSSGIKYADPSTAPWTLTSLGVGSTPSIATDGSKVGITYNDGGVKFIKNDGEGFSEPELIDVAGNNQALVMGDYTYAYYLKPNTSNSTQEIWFATNKPASTGVGTKLTFNYTVAPGDVSADLDYASTDAIKLNGGTIKDKSGNDANLTLPIPGETNSLGDNKAIIIDAVVPTIAEHDEVVAEATSIDGAIVEYISPTATDVFDGEVVVVCTPASGSQFNLGDNLVTCTASDALGNTSTSNFNVKVEDTTAPEITAPADVIGFVANGFLSSVPLGMATATDVVDANPMIVNDAPVAGFPVGTTIVTWTATDFSGNVNIATQNVTVVPDSIVKVAVSATSPVDTNSASIVTVTGRDQWNHITDNQSGTIVTIFPDNGGALGATVLTLVDGVAETTLRKATAGIVNLTVSSGSLIPGTTAVTFTQTDVVAPYIVTMSPNNGATDVAVSAPIFFDFSEALNIDTVNADNIKLMKVEVDSADTLVPGMVLAEGNQKVYFMPTANLEYSASYYFLVSGIADKADNVMTTNINADNSGFTTVENTADLTAPTVLGQSPLAEATGVALNSRAYIDFSEAMKATTLTTANIELRKVSDDSVVPTSISVENGGTRAVINPSANLDLETAYYIYVSSDVADEAGNLMGIDYVSGSFITVADNTVLGVTSITAIKSFATADDTWENGWQWQFEVTAPTEETNLRMKFADFISGSNVIPASSNIRFYSVQSSNANSGDNAIIIDEANTYSSIMSLTGDLDSSKLGRQINIIVEVKVPVGTVGGSYSTGYGVITNNEEPI